jgi:hypothetical protein
MNQVAENRERSEHHTPLKVFIGGSARSGTSILLFALKDVFGLPGHGESHVTPVFERMLSSIDESFARLEKIQASVLAKQLSRQHIEDHILTLLRDFYLEQYPSGRWVDKTPGIHAIRGLAYINRMFPDARLIATKRNGIEVVASHVKKFQSPFAKACLVWTNTMQALLQIRNSCQNLLEIDQYDFRNSAEQTSAQIAAHLGAPERAAALTQYLLTKQVQTSSAHDSSGRLTLSDVNWSVEQKEIFKRECGKLMETYGYAM